MMMKAFHLAAVACLVTAAVPARAQGTKTNLAESLYEEGVRLMDAGKTHDACDKFAASEKLEHALGTLLILAACHEKDGKVASAWAEYTSVAQQATRAGQRDREQYARAHAAAIEGQIHKLVINIVEPPPGLVVKLDGEDVGSGMLGTAVPMDPGAHSFEVSAPGKKSRSQSVQIPAGPGSEHVEVARLEDAPQPPPVTAPAPGASERPLVVGEAGEAPPSPSNGKRTLGYAIGGAGIAVLGLGVYYQVTSLSRGSDSNMYRAGGDTAGADAIHNQATTAQTYAIVAGGVALGAIGAGVVLVLTSSSGASSRKAKVYFAPTLGGGTVGGAF